MTVWKSVAKKSEVVQDYPRYLRGVFWSSKVRTIWLTNQVAATYQPASRNASLAWSLDFCPIDTALV